jgi:hypothetical protein
MIDSSERAQVAERTRAALRTPRAAPFAGIAFLWFIGVVRDRIGSNVYAMRMAAVFTISTTTIASRLGLAPRWLAVFGFGTGLVLLFTPGFVPWVELLFPAWVLAFSLHILVVSFRTPAPTS